jgi:hypothetical protein
MLLQVVKDSSMQKVVTMLLSRACDISWLSLFLPFLALSKENVEGIVFECLMNWHVNDRLISSILDRPYMNSHHYIKISCRVQVNIFFDNY